MNDVLTSVLSLRPRLSWLTGPIFDKELRVSSRRRRNYLLRFSYLALLTMFLIMFWIDAVPSGQSGLYQTSRMARAGQTIIAYIVWFQFIATQMIAVIMLSTSISDEIYHKTLGLLMTTPINSCQIVTGKLLSKLLQLLLLMAISLPLLAVVRVFGGVPWGYIVSGLCITLTTVLFVGSLSLFYSIFSRRAYVVIILTTLTVWVVFGLVPLFGVMYLEIGQSGPWSVLGFIDAVSYVNPYICLAIATDAMMSPRGVGWLSGAPWLIQCAVMLGGSVVLLFLSVLMVRRVALRQASGQPGGSPKEDRPPSEPGSGMTVEQAFRRAPRRVRGSAILWKELASPLFGRHKLAFVISIALGLILLFLTYAFFADTNALDDEWTHIVYGLIFMSLGTLFAIILPATCITSEKESRAWPLLLATTLDDWQILGGKFVGVLRRSLPIWCLLFGHIILFVLTGVIRPVAVFQTAMLVGWLVVFLSGSGLYFSARFKHTTTAVIANFALAAVVWGIAPLVMGLMAGIDLVDLDFVESYLDTNPFVHIAVIMDATAGGKGLSTYHWVDYSNKSAWDATAWMAACALGYASLGLLFAWRAKRRLRCNVF
ncbi:MAG: ABC transporter permease subunit [Sedimentisphaerales bacterium]|nr:ABC transporter permease subunit [Sedimentisphaerales bacterium]